MSAVGQIDASTVRRAHAVASGFYASGLDRDDLAQEALIGAWQARTTFREGAGASFRTLEEQCMRARVMDAVTKSRAGKRGAGEWTDELTPLVAGRDDVLATVIGRERLAELIAKLDKLPPEQRRAVVGVAAGYSYSEIGPDTKRVDNALFKARRKLAA